MAEGDKNVISVSFRPPTPIEEEIAAWRELIEYLGAPGLELVPEEEIELIALLKRAGLNLDLALNGMNLLKEALHGAEEKLGELSDSHAA